MKKILSLAMVGVMMFSALPMAYATNVYENPDANTQMGTAVEYVANSDANRAYTITVPAKLVPKQDAAVSGTVTLKGKWASNETVKVTADAEVELTNSINENDKHKLAITFPTMEYAGNNTEEKTYTETVSVAAMPAAALFGEWTGKFNYNVEFDDGIPDTVMFYDVKYTCTDTSYATTDLMFHEDGTMTGWGTNFADEGSAVGSYTTNGQSLTWIGKTGTFSDDGYSFTITIAEAEKTFVYTP